MVCKQWWSEAGRPSSHIFECDPLLSRDKLVEVYVYKASRPFMAAAYFVMDINTCSICAGTSDYAEGGKVDADLKTIYDTMTCFLFVACVRVEEQRLLLATTSPMVKRSRSAWIKTAKRQ